MIRNNIYKIFIAFLFLSLIWLMLFNYGHCASDQDYFPMGQNDNNKFSSSDIQYFDTACNTNDNYVFIKFFYSGTNNRYKNAYCLIFPKNANGRIYAEKNNDLIHFSLYTYGQPNSRIVHYQLDTQRGTWYLYRQYEGNGVSYFGNSESSKYNTSLSYISNYRLVTNNTSSAQVVLMYTPEPEYDDPDNDTYPNNADVPDIDNFIPDNEPSFDNTDTMSGLTSIFNFLTWLGDLIKGLFNYVVNALNWGLQKVINSVRNAITGLLSGIQTAITNAVISINGFLSDIKDKVDDITDKLTDFADLFIHPFDEEEYEEQIANCELISQYDQLIENCEDIQAIFNNATERDSFVLYIDFENPFADAQHKIITSEISFNWLVPLRSVYRPFLWVFTLVELFTGSMRLLGNIIGGKGK